MKTLTKSRETFISMVFTLKARNKRTETKWIKRSWLHITMMFMNSICKGKMKSLNNLISSKSIWINWTWWLREITRKRKCWLRTKSTSRIIHKLQNYKMELYRSILMNKILIYFKNFQISKSMSISNKK